MLPASLGASTRHNMIDKAAPLGESVLYVIAARFAAALDHEEYVALNELLAVEYLYLGRKGTVVGQEAIIKPTETQAPGRSRRSSGSPTKATFGLMAVMWRSSPSWITLSTAASRIRTHANRRCL